MLSATSHSLLQWMERSQVVVQVEHLRPKWHLSRLQSLINTWKCVRKLPKASLWSWECRFSFSHPEIELLISKSTSDLTHFPKCQSSDWFLCPRGPDATDQRRSAATPVHWHVFTATSKKVFSVHTGRQWKAFSTSQLRHHHSYKQHTLLDKEFMGLHLVVCTRSDLRQTLSVLLNCPHSHVHHLPSGPHMDLSPDRRGPRGEEC